MVRSVDLFVVGGGINGAAVARDAAGRGLHVQLAEKGDYAQETSSASSKLIHGGLRYLENFEFRLVRESLKEREVMMRIAPHLVFPLRFLIPITHRQPRSAFVVRAGLWLYDLLSGRRLLAPCGRLPPEEVRSLPGLKLKGIKSVLHYSDCWGDDSRLTLATLLDARSRGADIGNYREVTAIQPVQNGYQIQYRDELGAHVTFARFVVNAAGPWANHILDHTAGVKPPGRLRFVRGSHIVLPMPQPPLFDAFTLQLADNRVAFILPWLERYLIVGTTDINHEGDPANAQCSDQEREYLLACYNEFFQPGVSEIDIKWTYSGVRPLVDDGSHNPSNVTRDYKIRVLSQGKGGLITIYGGKLTTHRKLANNVMGEVMRLGIAMGPNWTDKEPLWGGAHNRQALAELAATAVHLSPALRYRWAFTYGSEATTLFETTRLQPSLAKEIVPGIPAAELNYSVETEDARTAEDFLYRRTKMFLSLDRVQTERIAKWFQDYSGGKSQDEHGYNCQTC